MPVQLDAEDEAADVPKTQVTRVFRLARDFDLDLTLPGDSQNRRSSRFCVLAAVRPFRQEAGCLFLCDLARGFSLCCRFAEGGLCPGALTSPR